MGAEDSANPTSPPKHTLADSIINIADTPVETAVQCDDLLRMPSSKKQMKKLKKLENLKQKRLEKRVRERVHRKEKRKAALEQGLPTHVGPSRKELKRKQKTAVHDSSALNIAIDLDYDDLMMDRDISKCIKQCLRIYTINRRAARPCHLHFTGIKLNGRIHNVLKRNDGFQHWQVIYHFDVKHHEVFDKEKIIYLTCESNNTLDKLNPELTYVIGGLVDHNHQKGLCHERAVADGLQTARLPLSEHVDMKTRAVLSTFHVFEMLTLVAAGKSWKEAIVETLPQRKGAKLKEDMETQEKTKPEVPVTLDIPAKLLATSH